MENRRKCNVLLEVRVRNSKFSSPHRPNIFHDENHLRISGLNFKMWGIAESNYPSIFQLIIKKLINFTIKCSSKYTIECNSFFKELAKLYLYNIKMFIIVINIKIYITSVIKIFECMNFNYVY